MTTISTAWNAKKYLNPRAPEGSGGKLVEEIFEIGFDSIELNIEIPEPVYREIITALKKRNMKVISVHNFFPRVTPPEGRSLLSAYLLSSKNEEEREKAMALTKNTIDYACESGAKAIVVHFGFVETEIKTAKLIELYKNNSMEELAFLRDKLIEERSKNNKIYLELAMKSLDVLCKYARDKNIKIGLESRYYYEEIPDFEEVGVILDKFKGDSVYYWHDTGHAQVAENLGFAKHEDFLKCYNKKMLGIHIHDIVGCNDHKAPGVGSLDFKMIKKYLNGGVLKVLEPHSKVTREELVTALNFLKSIDIL